MRAYEFMQKLSPTIMRIQTTVISKFWLWLLLLRVRTITQGQESHFFAYCGVQIMIILSLSLCNYGTPKLKLVRRKKLTKLLEA